MIGILNIIGSSIKKGTVVPKYKPVANFVGAPTTLNQNNTVDFTDLSTVDPLGPAITEWSWVFEGAVPSTSTVQNPTNINYPTPGLWDVQLTATNADGSGINLKTEYITVNEFVPPFTVNSFNIGNYYINVGEYQDTDFQLGSYGINL